MYNTRLQ